MRTREIRSLEKIWASFVSWNQSEDDGSQNQAAIAKEKAKAKCKKSCDCEHFGEWSKKNISCKSCTGIVSEICQFLTKEDLARKEAEEKAKRAEEKAARGGKRGPLELKGKEGEFLGIKKNSSMYEFFLYLLMNGPTGMTKVKKDIRRSHYATAKKFPGIFRQNAKKQWYVAI